MKNLTLIIHLFTGTLILSIVGLYNGYPLVYSDTGTYIASGLKEFVPVDRPVGYGLFIKLFSFNYSLWFVVAFQNLITAFVIYELLRTFNLSNKYFSAQYYSILTFLVLFTGIGWYSNQVMPDFFAPLSILILYILLKNGELHIVNKSILYLIFVFSLVTHFSHLLICLIIILLVITVKLTFNGRFINLSFKKILSTSLIILAGWILIPTINYAVEREFYFSKGNHAFLMAHLIDTGILEKFLNDKCDEEDFKDCRLCDYKDSLPTDLASFLWPGDILDSTGGWLGSKEEYNKIIRATLKEPKYLFLNIYKSFTYGLIQLTKNRIGQGLSSYGPGSPPYGQIHWEFHHELNNYLNSRQISMNGFNLKLEALNLTHLFVLILSLFLMVFLFTTPLLFKTDQGTIRFLVYVILAVILNSFITAGLTSPCDRFQARIVWLVPLALIILMIKNIKNYKNAI